jgi:hypothetical protein
MFAVRAQCLPCEREKRAKSLAKTKAKSSNKLKAAKSNAKPREKETGIVESSPIQQLTPEEKKQRRLMQKRASKAKAKAKGSASTTLLKASTMPKTATPKSHTVVTPRPSPPSLV